MFDVAVIGGSFAGLTAALQLGRASRSVVVIDAGCPRNRTSPAAHGVAGWDGFAPREILARFQADLAAYPTVQLREGTVMQGQGGPDAFGIGIGIDDGEEIAARRIVLAHGVRDILPEIPGLAEGWGRRVLHCPYCHGYEVKGMALAVLATHPMSAHQALMLRADWSDDVTLITGGMEGLDEGALRAAGIRVVTGSLTAAAADQSGISLTLTSGNSERFGALFLGPRTTLSGSPAEGLGCATDDGPMGRFVRVGSMAQTSVPGVFAAGDVARPMAQRVAIAAARAGGARIVIADEPTKGLDAARRDDVAALLLSEMGETGALLVITHDLALARRLGGRLIVLRAGRVVERGSTEQVFAAPEEAYTREFLAADPERWTPRPQSSRSGSAVVSARGLALLRGGRTLFDDVSLDIAPGEVFGVTGPSGCGKSSLGDACLGLIEPARGTISRRPGNHPHDFQKLYQDPVAAFPRKRALGQTIAETARLSGARAGDVEAWLDRLGLQAGLLARRPGAVSGGELQRLSLLRVLLRNPSFIFADEPTSRLDPITQARVIALLLETTELDGTALMLVSHDAALIRNTADTVIALEEPGTPSRSDIALPERRVALALH